MLTAAIILAAWLAVGFPVAVLFGRRMRRMDGR